MLEVKPKTLDLGEISLGSKHYFTLEVTNTSDVSVDFDLKPSCSSCTTVHLESRTIAPNSSITAECVFEPNSTGRIPKTINLYKGKEIVEKFTFLSNVVK